MAAQGVAGSASHAFSVDVIAPSTNTDRNLMNTKPKYTTPGQLWQSPSSMRVLSTLGLAVLVVACDAEQDAGAAAAVPTNKPTQVAAVEGGDAVDYEAEYAAAKQLLQDGQLEGLEPRFRTLANQAKNPSTRANSAMALGSLLEEKGDRAGAISSYRLARRLLPEEPAPLAVLGLALFAHGDLEGALGAQSALVELTPDDLRAWLYLGEIATKAGKGERAKQAYAAYEVRRKGLLDGLTITEEGTPVLDVPSRIRSVEFLEAAIDEGTGLALLYALKSDPDAQVRDAIAETMGIQRLRGYEAGLREHLATQTDPESKRVAQWALDEIARDPVDIASGSAPAASLEAPLPPGAAEAPVPPPSQAPDGEPAAPAPP
jgi:tetratricopeptide (TPR) repeat protein